MLAITEIYYLTSCATEFIEQSGTLPTEISKLASLEFLAMEDGTRGGTIPPKIFKLKEFFLHIDKQLLNGTIPEEIFGMIDLTTLDLNTNILTGTLSESIGDLINFKFFQVDSNSL